MNFVLTAFLCLLAWPALPVRGAQHSPGGEPKTSNIAPHRTAITSRYSTNPYVIEKYTTSFRLENDGTGERDFTAAIRIQNDVAAKQLSKLSFSFDAKTVAMEVPFVRIRRPDNNVIDAGPEAVTEETAAAVRDAPAYANAKEKHIAVPPLRSGDVLEYEITTRFIRPVAPGYFWAQHTFLKDAIVLEERVEINIPQGRRVTVRSTNFPYSIDVTSEKTRTIYRWKHANLALPPDGNENEALSPAKVRTQPDIQITSFTNWSDVSRWYDKLAHNTAEPTPEIYAKASELIQNRASELDKIQAIYGYVAREIRYVDLPLGTAGFEPHTAAEVFKNQYGDAKDKHSLLAAMLQVAGFQARVALIPKSQKLDISTPSPSQLDHVITVVARGNDMLWMDATSDVAPFRFLPPSLRDKSALLSTSNGAGQITETPPDPPFRSIQDVEVEAHVNDLGKLTAHVRYQMRGDNEFILRTAFRRTPPSQWKDLGQTLLTLDGLHGEVTVARSSDPLDTRDPFEVDLEYTQLNFFDWSARKEQVAIPLLSIGVPDIPTHNALRIELGSPLHVSTHLKLSLPASFAATAPVGIAVSRDYAEFKSSYQWGDSTLTAERLLDFKMREISASRRGDYLAFKHAVDADQTQPLVVASNTTGAPVIPSGATATELFESGAAALVSGNVQSAIPLLGRAVVLEPAHKEAWNSFGLAHLRVSHFDQAVASFEKQLEVNPADEHTHNYLGLALEQQQKYDEAIAAFQNQIAIDPLDATAHGALGTILLAQHRYFEAVPELDKATVLSPGKAEIQISLGEAYINLGEDEKAAESFDRAVQISPTPGTWTRAAYNLADHNVDLSMAQKYAESAVSAGSAALSKIDLSHLSAAQLRDVARIGNYWDTLGWAYFREGNIGTAERYIRAAWLLDQYGEIGDHLAQIYEKRGNRKEAVRIFALALATQHPNPDTRARLTLLLGGNSQIDELVSQATPQLVTLRTLSVGKLLNENVQADFVLVLSPDKTPRHFGRVASVRFLEGSEKLRVFAGRLRTIDYGPIFPDASPVNLVRRGTLSCSASTNNCTFTLLTPDDVPTADMSH